VDAKAASAFEELDDDEDDLVFGVLDAAGVVDGVFAVRLDDGVFDVVGVLLVDIRDRWTADSSSVASLSSTPLLREDLDEVDSGDWLVLSASSPSSS
jgi:hypothetical protein